MAIFNSEKLNLMTFKSLGDVQEYLLQELSVIDSSCHVDETVLGKRASNFDHLNHRLLATLAESCKLGIELYQYNSKNNCSQHLVTMQRDFLKQIHALAIHFAQKHDFLEILYSEVPEIKSIENLDN